jgi:hypothetical protein
MSLSSGIVLNGVRYGAESYSITIANQPIVAITELTYEDGLEGKFIYGTSELAIGRTRGSYTCTAAMAMPMYEWSELETILMTGPQQSVSEFVFNIGIYISEIGQKPQNHFLMYNRIKKISSPMPGTGGNDAAIVHIDLQPYYIMRNGTTAFRRQKIPVPV